MRRLVLLLILALRPTGLTGSREPSWPFFHRGAPEGGSRLSAADAREPPES